MKMKNLLACSAVFAGVVTSANASLVIVDFTNDPGSNNEVGAGISLTNPIFNNYDFGGGRTADITVTTAGTALNSIATGVGVSDGTQGNRIGLNEDITITFSDFQGGLTANDISFSGFVSSTLATTGVWAVESGDVFDINGAALTGTNAGDGAAADLDFSYDIYVYQNLDSVATVALNGSNALVLDLTTDAGGGYRLQGLALEVAAVPEPSSTALLGLGGLALILRRRK